MRLGLLEFYGISTIDHINVKFSLYIHIRYMIFKHILLRIFLNEPQLIFSLLNGFTYFYQIQTFLFIINHFLNLF